MGRRSRSLIFQAGSLSAFIFFMGVSEPQCLEQESRPFEYLGNFPIQRSEQSGKRLDVEAFKTHYFALHTRLFHHSLMNRAADRAIAKDRLEADVLSQLNDPRIKIVVDESAGRPVLAKEIRELTDEKGGIYYADKYERRAQKKTGIADLVRAEALETVREMAELSRRYPENLIGMNEDDFLAKRKAPTILNRDFFKQMCREARSIQPRFTIGATLYCMPTPAADESEKNAYLKFLTPDQADRIDFSKGTRQVEAFVQYISDSEVKDCIGDISVYNPGIESAPGQMGIWSDADVGLMNSCIEVLKPTGKVINVGIYMSAYESLSLENRLSNIELALKTAADGFVFFLMPTKPWANNAKEEKMNEVVYNRLKSLKEGTTPLPNHEDYENKQ